MTRKFPCAQRTVWREVPVTFVLSYKGVCFCISLSSLFVIPVYFFLLFGLCLCSFFLFILLPSFLLQYLATSHGNIIILFIYFPPFKTPLLSLNLPYVSLSFTSISPVLALYSPLLLLFLYHGLSRDLSSHTSFPHYRCPNLSTVSNCHRAFLSYNVHLPPISHCCPHKYLLKTFKLTFQHN